MRHGEKLATTVCRRQYYYYYMYYIMLCRPPPPPPTYNNNNAGGPFARQEDRCRSSDSSWWCSRPDPRHRHADAVFPDLFTRSVRSSPARALQGESTITVLAAVFFFFLFSFNDRFIRTLIFLNITLGNRDLKFFYHLRSVIWGYNASFFQTRTHFYNLKPTQTY